MSYLEHLAAVTEARKAHQVARYNLAYTRERVEYLSKDGEYELAAGFAEKLRREMADVLRTGEAWVAALERLRAARHAA